VAPEGTRSKTGAMQIGAPAQPITQVPLGRWRQADGRASVFEQSDVAVAEMGRVDDSGLRAKRAAGCEQGDGTHAVLSLALMLLSKVMQGTPQDVTGILTNKTMMK
jgi:hypothetical protein